MPKVPLYLPHLCTLAKSTTVPHWGIYLQLVMCMNGACDDNCDNDSGDKLGISAVLSAVKHYML